MVLDFSVSPSLTEIDLLIQCASNILHQDPKNALLLILPQKYSGQSCKTCLTHQRRIEDALLGSGISLETEIAMHFVIDGMHGNDKRPLSARAKLCYSEKVVHDDNCPWLLGHAARGKMSDVPLLRIKEMKRLCAPGYVGEPVEAYNLSPAERCQQKGAKAAQKMVEYLVQDTPLASPECRLDIMEIQLHNVPDWVEGAWNMRSSWASDSSKPRVTYTGFTREALAAKTVTGHMEAVLMAEYWEGSQQAGPLEPEDSGPVEKPKLSIANWEDAVPGLADVVTCKFDGDETYGAKWHAKVAAFRDYIANTITPLVQRPVTRMDGAAGGGTGASGPDFTVGGKPPVYEEVVLPCVGKAEFETANV